MKKLEAKVKRAMKAVEDEKKREEERAAKLAAKKAEVASSSRANPLNSSRNDSNPASNSN